MIIIRVCSALLLVATTSFAASWESFPLRDNGSIPVWTVAGPLPDAHTLARGTSCVACYRDYLEAAGGESGSVPGEGDPMPLDGAGALQWQTAFSEPSGLLDYIDTLGVSKETSGAAYAFCRLIATARQEVVLKVRSNDSVRIWLDDALIHDQHVNRMIDQAEDTVPVTLAEGEHRLLVKVGQASGNWAVLVRVLARDGQPVRSVRSAVRPR